MLKLTVFYKIDLARLLDSLLLILDGKWDGQQLILDEKFNWNDGEIQTRQWKINKIDEHNYEGTASDVVGTAKGFSYGPAFKFEYVLLVPVKEKKLKLPLMTGFLSKTNE